MKYDARQEQQLLTDLLGFANDPYGFAMYNYPWGMPGTPLARHSGPREWQTKVLLEIRDHVSAQEFSLDNGLPLAVFQEAIASGRGIGKSALFAILADWMVSCHIGATVGVTANTEKQITTKTFPEFGRWFTMGLNSHWWDVSAMQITPQKWLAQMVRDQLHIDTQYWEVQGLNWSEENPDAFAGTHNSYGLAIFYDEASGIPEPIWKVTKGFFTEETAHRLWVAFSQGRRNSGAFFDRFKNPAYAPYWITKHIDARTVEGTDKSVYQEILDTNGEDSDAARVEVYGLFPEQGDNQFIANSAVEGAQRRELPRPPDLEAALIVGVDPAPRGRTAIRFRAGRDARSLPPVILKGHNNPQIVNALLDIVETMQPDAIAVDAGQGTGVIDGLRAAGVRNVYEVWFGAAAEGIHRRDKRKEAEEWATLGTELWACMRDWLPTGCIDDSMELHRDLTKRTWQWHGREEAKKILTSKKVQQSQDGIPSPDDGDALALTFYPRILRRQYRGVMGGPRERVAEGVGECFLG